MLWIPPLLESHPQPPHRFVRLFPLKRGCQQFLWSILPHHSYYGFPTARKRPAKYWFLSWISRNLIFWDRREALKVLLVRFFFSSPPPPSTSWFWFFFFFINCPILLPPPPGPNHPRGRSSPLHHQHRNPGRRGACWRCSYQQMGPGSWSWPRNHSHNRASFVRWCWRLSSVATHFPD